MRVFKLPGYEKINPMILYQRTDENPKPTRKKNEAADEEGVMPQEEIGMGGPEGRVYWPPGQEEWLRPKKREQKPKDTEAKMKTPKKIKKGDEGAEEVGPKLTQKPPKKRARKSAQPAAVPTPSTSDNHAKVTKRQSKRSARISYQEQELSE
jgi:UV DNA damage endonuclease